jgi:hypothetical protein
VSKHVSIITYAVQMSNPLFEAVESEQLRLGKAVLRDYDSQNGYVRCFSDYCAGHLAGLRDRVKVIVGGLPVDERCLLQSGEKGGLPPRDRPRGRGLPAREREEVSPVPRRSRTDRRTETASEECTLPRKPPSRGRAARPRARRRCGTMRLHKSLTNAVDLHDAHGASAAVADI